MAISFGEVKSPANMYGNNMISTISPNEVQALPGLPDDNGNDIGNLKY